MAGTWQRPAAMPVGCEVVTRSICSRNPKPQLQCVDRRQSTGHLLGRAEKDISNAQTKLRGADACMSEGSMNRDAADFHGGDTSSHEETRETYLGRHRHEDKHMNECSPLWA